MDTSPPNLPTTPVAPAGRRRRPWWAYALAVVSFGLVFAVAAAAFVDVPYYGISPGDARSVNTRITVTGVDSYEPEGEEQFVTVGVPKLTALGALLGWLDPHTDVYAEERVLGDRTEEENRKENLRLMGYSKDFATYVALRELGYPVEIEGGGVSVDSLCMEPSADGTTCLRESPAAEVLDPGDIIVQIDDTAVHLTPEISDALQGKEPGDTVEVTVIREKERLAPVEATLTEGDDGRTILGIVPNPNPPEGVTFTFPFDVTINSGQVGGPSAGLAFTLALLDELTPGELTGGTKVAATGTISPSGQVGEIGGLRQKTVAVLRKGAEMFLVPASEVAEAEAVAKGTGLKVVGVRTLDDALEALSTLGGSNAMALGTPGAAFQPEQG
jgi:PDZ domain-containing protein